MRLLLDMLRCILRTKQKLTGISHELNEFNGLNSLNSFNSWLIPAFVFSTSGGHDTGSTPPALKMKPE